MKNAFTIVEVLVVISIMGLIMGVGAVRLRDFQRKQELVAAKRLLLTDVREAQSDAASGRKPAGCVGTLLGYGFGVITSSPVLYEITAICDDDVVVKSVSLPASIRLSGAPSSPVIFKPVQKGTNFSGSISISITRDGLSNSELLFITASGEIR